MCAHERACTTPTSTPTLSLAVQAGARAGARIPTLLVYRPHLQEEADLIHARVLRDEVLEEQVWARILFLYSTWQGQGTAGIT